MQRVNWGAVSALAGLLGLRMLGLFMVLPVLALYVQQMPGATPLAAGLALGIYGLTQALLQLPFGRLSDRWGRKPVILAGLVLFAAGSVIAAAAATPEWLIAGRALQGAGAISAAVLALASDLTPDTQRTRVMALIGMMIGMAFILAFVVGPTFAAWFGVAGLFWMSAGFALVGMLLLATLRAPAPVPAAGLLSLRQVLPLVAPQAAGIFVLHAIMTASFLAIPLLLLEDLQIPPSRHGWVYLPVMLGSLLVLAPLVLLQERHSGRWALLLAVLGLSLGQAGMLMVESATLFYVALVVFFGGFNFVEAQFPAVVASKTGQRGRGAGLGIYATAQFSGAFAGGLGGGMLASWGGTSAVLWGNAGMAAFWLAVLLATRSLPGTGGVNARVE